MNSVASGGVKVLLTPEEAAEALGVGRTTVFGLLRDGRIGSVRIGASRRIPTRCLQAYVDELLGGGQPSQARDYPQPRARRSRQPAREQEHVEVLTLPFVAEATNDPPSG